MKKLNVAGTALLAVLLLVGLTAVARADGADFYAYDGHMLAISSGGSGDVSTFNLNDMYAWDGQGITTPPASDIGMRPSGVGM